MVSRLTDVQRMLADSGVGQPADIERAQQQAQGLGMFVRGIVGLDCDAATDALVGFITGRTLTAIQLDFHNLIVNYLTEHGVMDAGRLYGSRFTELAPLGPASRVQRIMPAQFLRGGQVAAQIITANGTTTWPDL